MAAWWRSSTSTISRTTRGSSHPRAAHVGIGKSGKSSSVDWRAYISRRSRCAAGAGVVEHSSSAASAVERLALGGDLAGRVGPCGVAAGASARHATGMPTVDGDAAGGAPFWQALEGLSVQIACLRGGGAGLVAPSLRPIGRCRMGASPKET
jgi:hypothetical protein